MSVPYISEEDFKATVQSQTGPFLVDFTASWCGPCKALAPVLDLLNDEYQGKITIVKVDVDQNRPLAGAFGIRSVPTLILFKDGAEVDKKLGALNKAQLEQFISQTL